MGKNIGRAFKIALKASGRNYDVAPGISDSMLVGEMLNRGSQMVRGIVRTRKPVFLGANVSFRGISGFKAAPGVSVGPGTHIDARGRRGVTLGPASRLGRGGVVTTTSHFSLLGVGLTLASNSGVGDFFHIGCSGGVEIGKDVIIGPYFSAHSQNHIYSDPNVPIRNQGTTQASIIIGNDCWIGAKVTILAGTVLGPRTIVAAGAVVHGVHPGNEILGGVPAKRIKALDPSDQPFEGQRL